MTAPNTSAPDTSAPDRPSPAVRIDPRGLRFAAAVTTVVLALALLTGNVVVLALQAIVFAAGVLLGRLFPLPQRRVLVLPRLPGLPARPSRHRPVGSGHVSPLTP